MKRSTLVLCLILLAPMSWAAETAHLDTVKIDLSDKDSLRRGAKLFVNYCLSCHSASYMRYNRMGKDLGISDEVVKNNLMFASEKVGEQMTINLDPDEAKTWFGVVPPDLTVTSRSRGANWIYTYLRSFYVDSSSATGWNNKVFDRVAMPHVLYPLQGMPTASVSEKDGAKTIELVPDPSASLNPQEFDTAMRDLTSFMVYLGEPVQQKRKEMGVYVLAFLVLLSILAYLLKKEYWRDVH